jgi:UPF0716 protein FxsA
MIPLLIVLFVIGPLAELYLLLAVGGAIGALPVIALCIATAVAGGLILRWQGLAAIKAAQSDLRDGRVPVEAAVDAVFLVLAAPMLMLPGFITDAMGFLLLIPPVRHFLARAALRRLRRSVESGAARVEFRRF